MTKMRDKRLWLAAALCVAGLGALSMPNATVQAADHGDPGTAAAAGAADIADFYAWHDETNVKFIITYAGIAAAGGEPVYDRDVLYQIHIDEDGDAVPEHSIEIRFGQDAADDSWGVQAINVPGSAGAIEGAVAGNITEGDVMLHAGLHDDPFFFDLAGFTETVTTGVASFASLDPEGDGPVDAAEGLNAMGIVVEFPTAALGSTSFQTWATVGQIGG